MTVSDISKSLDYAKSKLDYWSNIRATISLSFETIQTNIDLWTLNVNKLQTALDTSVNTLISGL